MQFFTKEEFENKYPEYSNADISTWQIEAVSEMIFSQVGLIYRDASWDTISVPLPIKNASMEQMRFLIDHDIPFIDFDKDIKAGTMSSPLKTDYSTLALRILANNGYLYPNVEIVPLAKKYPQGGEKQLVDAVIRRQVPAPPAIPVNVGAIVQNVGTAFAVYQAVMKNKPLFERYTTVTGKKVANPGNFLVRMGTPMKELIDFCGGMPEEIGRASCRERV